MAIAVEKRALIERICSPRSSGETQSRIMRIDTGAGIGKSTLIDELCKLAADKRILFLAMSRNIADRASLSAPDNVSVHTFYTQALEILGIRYQKKLSRQSSLPSRIPAQAIMNSGFVSSLQEANAVRDTVDNWIWTDRAVPDEDDIPDWVKEKHDAGFLQLVASAARSVVTSQRNPDTSTIPLTFKSLIREWACFDGRSSTNTGNSNDDIFASPFGEAELVIIEESQDCPPIVFSQLNRHSIDVVMIGDPYQTLIGYGEVDDHQLSYKEDEYEPYRRAGQLNTSYRFGPSIASLLNAMTFYLAGDSDQHRLHGGGRSSLYMPERRAAFLTQGISYTFIARRLGTIWLEAMSLGKQGIELAWVDGIDSYHAQAFLDLLTIAMEEIGFTVATRSALRNRHEDSSLDAILSRARNNHESRIYQLASVCRTLQAHRYNYLPVLEHMMSADRHRQKALIENWTAPISYGVMFSTVIRAKGLEFDRVVVADDLAPDWMFRGNIKGLKSRIGFNQLYTALSRAKYELVIPLALASWIKNLEDEQACKLLLPNQIPEEEHPVTPIWNKQFGPSTQILSMMNPAGRHTRQPVNDIAERSMGINSTGKAFYDELKRQQASMTKGPQSLKAAIAGLKTIDESE